MPINSLREYLTLLDARDELTRVTVETDPVLEIAAITDRVCKRPAGGRALLFENPRGAGFPVATNLFGSPSRTCLALGVDQLGSLTARMSALLGRIHAPALAQLDQQIGALPEFSRFAALQLPPGWTEVMQHPDLTVFPFLQSWPGDGAAGGHPRYITLPQVFTANPDGSAPNCGMYRAQLLGPRELAIRWKAGSGAARHLAAFQRLGKPLPVAIALGGDPACLFSAMLPLPGELDEMTFAGFLRGVSIGMAACRTNPLQVPSQADVVIEGFVDPAETALEGPFGNHTGYYSPAGPAALMRVTAISLRPGAIVPATVVGPPPMEDCWMAKSWERLLLAFLQKLAPSINDIHFPLEWIFHQSAIISLEKPLPGVVREIAALLWAMPWFSAARLLVFVDAEVGSAGLSGVAWHAINLPGLTRNLFHDSDHKRLALDATNGSASRLPLCSDPAINLLLQRRWQEYGI
ncbi:MAG: UbiD family decarboxylase [Geobacteraceae bacterium]|nr:UbiD family decarboxylase [Geobacteraceae bacterium]